MKLCLLPVALIALQINASSGQSFYVGPILGNWDSGANWSGGIAPSGGDDVVIDDLVQNSTVTIGPSLARQVDSLRVAAGDRLLLSNNSTLQVNGPLVEMEGTLELASSGNSTSLVFGGGTSLTGAGSILLGSGSMFN